MFIESDAMQDKIEWSYCSTSPAKLAFSHNTIFSTENIYQYIIIQKKHFSSKNILTMFPPV